MPIPVSVTHKQGAGLQAATHESLPTSSMFESLGRSAVHSKNGSKVENLRNEKDGIGHPSNITDEALSAVQTNDLTFWYCDIGSCTSICFLPHDLNFQTWCIVET